MLNKVTLKPNKQEVENKRRKRKKRNRDNGVGVKTRTFIAAHQGVTTFSDEDEVHVWVTQKKTLFIFSN